MIQHLKKLLQKVTKPVAYEYRIVKENRYDAIAMEMDTVYYIQKRNSLSWSNINHREFDTIQEAETYYSKIKEYINNKQLDYTYLK